MSEPKAILIAGPTASGKSHLAVALAESRNGVVINADSMQVYAELRVLTARPTPEDDARVPHRLYGHIAATERYSVGRWLADVASELRTAGRLPVVVGGTGLYFKALTEGLATVPPIPESVRQRVRDEAAGEETPALHALLAERDPEGAAMIRPSDRSRILRALDVLAATGQSLGTWQRAEAEPPLVGPGEAIRIVLAPERAALHHRISDRTEQMGRRALAEVADLLALDLAPDMPVMKAIGVGEFSAHLRGDITFDEAIAAIKTETRRYAKRQMTWIRNQMADWRVITDPAMLDLVPPRA